MHTALKCQAMLKHISLEEAAILEEETGSKHMSASLHLASVLLLTVQCF